MTLTLNEFFIRSKPELFAILAAIYLCFILLLVLSIKVSRRREEESLPEGSRRRARKRFIFRKILITLFVILLIVAIACTIFSFIARNGKIVKMTTTEPELASVHYLYSIDGKTLVIATLTNYHCYYYADDGRIKTSNTPANNTSIEFISDGTAPRIAEYKETPIRYELYDNQVLEAKRLDNETKVYYVLYVPQAQGTISFGN